MDHYRPPISGGVDLYPQSTDIPTYFVRHDYRQDIIGNIYQLRLQIPVSSAKAPDIRTPGEKFKLSPAIPPQGAPPLPRGGPPTSIPKSVFGAELGLVGQRVRARDYGDDGGVTAVGHGVGHGESGGHGVGHGESGGFDAAGDYDAGGM
jgi:hypothetical protein